MDMDVIYFATDVPSAINLLLLNSDRIVSSLIKKHNDSSSGFPHLIFSLSLSLSPLVNNLGHDNMQSSAELYGPHDKNAQQKNGK